MIGFLARCAVRPCPVGAGGAGGAAGLVPSLPKSWNFGDGFIAMLDLIHSLSWTLNCYWSGTFLRESLSMFIRVMPLLMKPSLQIDKDFFG